MTVFANPIDRQQVLQELSARLRQRGLRADCAAGVSQAPSATAGTDCWPDFAPGSLIEWLAEGDGTGVMTLAAAVLAQQSRSCVAWVVIDAGEFSPRGMGRDEEPFVLIRPRTFSEAAWALEQSLRSPGVGMTWAWVDRASERMLRRWKLASEAGGGIGVFFRPALVRRDPTWADVRWLVKPLGTTRQTVRRWRVELLYARGRLGVTAFDVELDHDTNAVRAIPAVSGAAAVRPAAGA